MLDLIAQRNKNGIWSGNIAVGGNSIQETNKSHGLAYVYQSDMLIATLTVEETIRYSTWLHLSSSLSDFEKEARVQSVITQLSLERVRRNKVFDEVTQCGLSGGERKRLSIATQIVADPRFILLDEPTSGLDSALSMEVMSTVRKFCTKDRTVLTTIHQPSRAIFALFDKVLILVQGRLIFYGSTNNALTHFTSTNVGYKLTNKYQNPSEFILDICRGQIIPENSNVRMVLTDLVGAYENSIYYKTNISEVHTELARINNNNNNNYNNSTTITHNKTEDSHSSTSNNSITTPNFSVQVQSLFGVSSLTNPDSPKSEGIQYARSTLSQLLILTYRNWKSKIRNKSDLKSHIIKNISLGVLWGLIFFQKGDPNGPFYENGYSEAKVQTLNSLLLQLTVFAAYTNLSIVDSLTQSTALYHRELGNQSYSPLAYALSQALSTLPIQLVTIFILVFAMYFLSGLPPSGAYFFFLYLCTFLAVYCSYAMTLAVTAWVGDISLIYMIVPVVADIMVSISGYAPTVDYMPSFYEGLSYINFARWQFQAMMINHWTRYDTDDGDGYDENGNGDVLDYFNFDGIHKFNCLWILLLFTFVALVIFYWGVLPAKSRLHKVSNAEDARIVLAKIAATQSQQASFLHDFIPQISSTGDLKEKLIVPDASLLVEEEPVVIEHPAHLTVQSFSQSNIENDLSEGCTLVFRSVSAPPLRGTGIDDGDSSDFDSVSSLSDLSGSEKITPGRTTAGAPYTATIPTPKTMYVQGVSGMVLPGEMCAIMGSSGAGKSSLLNILSQRKNADDYSGKVYYNGNLGVLPPFGFVTQDDLHVDVMTVREALEFAGELRLPEGMPKAEKQRRIDRILSILLLQGVADSIVGGQFRHGISGGELKRLSIGVELLHFPGLMFLDEPTTGLDSSTSLEVLSALRNLANQQRTIIMTLHQPSQEMFQLFDRIMIMAASRVVYFGGVHNCEKYFTESPFAFAFPNTMDIAEYMIASAGSFIPSIDGRTVAAGELAAYYTSSQQCLAMREMVRALVKTYQRNSIISTTNVQSITDKTNNPIIRNTTTTSNNNNNNNEVKIIEPHLSLKYQLTVLLGRKYLIIRRNWRTYMWKGVK